eukprot:TRINITY_DN20744_c0_g1_i1.p1 TRINITY_DN20744_c0_g1~~TRINITY_DN20744_c0_g1_i1.p1  ORF type:complete len:533 (+),score=79.93 TRINITY_DN20744_c0_g1_i1:67-1665(+)
METQLQVLILICMITICEAVQISSVNGLLEVTLTMDVHTFYMADGSKFTARVYNSTIPGPTLRVMRGDLVRITVANNLESDADGTMDSFRMPNTTNLHLHGLHVSPVLPGDDVTVSIPPGSKRTYEYVIPEDHAPGLHWYHPHFHGSSALQVFGGAYGLVRVLGDEGIAGMLPTYTIPIQFMHWDGRDSAGLSSNSIIAIGNISKDRVSYDNTPKQDVWLVDGSVRPIYKVKQCESTRLSLAFTSAGSQLNLTMVNESKSVTCDMQLISRDGHQLHRYPRPLKGRVFVPAGGRVDVLLRCTVPCRYTLKTDSRIIAVFDVQGMEFCEPAITPLSLVPTYQQPGYAVDLRGEKINPKNRMDIQLIDGKGCRFKTVSPVLGVMDGWYSMEREKNIRHVTPLGSVQEVVLSDSVKHPFHVHVSPFQIISGTTVADEGNFEAGDWADTVQYSELVFRTRPLSFTGLQMFHCHVLSHEDQGCMAEIEIVPPRRDHHSLAGHYAFHPLLPILILLVLASAIGAGTLLFSQSRVVNKWV